MEVVDSEGKPEYVESTSPAGLTVLSPKTAKRLLMPFHRECWILSALIEINARDGSLTGTGDHAWVPVSGTHGPVALLPNEEPTDDTTRCVIDVIRQERRKSSVEKVVDWEAEAHSKELAKWQAVYDQIRDASTAFYNVPGSKAHVSFPSSTIQ